MVGRTGRWHVERLELSSTPGGATCTSSPRSDVTVPRRIASCAAAGAPPRPTRRTTTSDTWDIRYSLRGKNTPRPPNRRPCTRNETVFQGEPRDDAIGNPMPKRRYSSNNPCSLAVIPVYKSGGPGRRLLYETRMFAAATRSTPDAPTTLILAGCVAAAFKQPPRRARRDRRQPWTATPPVGGRDNLVAPPLSCAPLPRDLPMALRPSVLVVQARALGTPPDRGSASSCPLYPVVLIGSKRTADLPVLPVEGRPGSGGLRFRAAPPARPASTSPGGRSTRPSAGSPTSLRHAPASAVVPFWDMRSACPSPTAARLFRDGLREHSTSLEMPLSGVAVEIYRTITETPLSSSAAITSARSSLDRSGR